MSQLCKALYNNYTIWWPDIMTDPLTFWLGVNFVLTGSTIFAPKSSKSVQFPKVLSPPAKSILGDKGIYFFRSIVSDARVERKLSPLHEKSSIGGHKRMKSDFVWKQWLTRWTGTKADQKSCKSVQQWWWCKDFQWSSCTRFKILLLTSIKSTIQTLKSVCPRPLRDQTRGGQVSLHSVLSRGKSPSSLSLYYNTRNCTGKLFLA